ncbi:MAG: alpha/beta fold hydrolase [Gemmatimonadota bacterium]
MGSVPPLLSHARVSAGAEPGRWLLFLHGIFGAGRNWASFARRLVEARPDWGAVLVDLRLHGDSRGFAPPHTLAACAADVRRLAARLGAGEIALLGHSFGGKVALAALAAGPPRPRQIWVVDSTPDAGPPRGSAAEMLAALRELPPTFETRREAVRALEGRGFGRSVAEWMATNLEPRDSAYAWRFEVEAMAELLADFFRSDVWSIVLDPPGEVSIHVVKAEASDVLTEEACARIEDGSKRTRTLHLHRVPGGHWVNLENPGDLLELLRRWLP